MIFHVTDLDALVWYHKTESMTVGDVLGRLLRTEEPNELMLKGTAWHSILEGPPETIDAIERNGFAFRVDCDAEISLPQIREIRGEKDYTIDGKAVTLTGGCDGISGNKVTDHKLTFRPNPETYFESFQWRAYLDIFNADIFEYIIYSARDRKDETIIYDISPMLMYRYPEMERDLEQGIRNLVGFCQIHMPNL